MAYYVFTFHFRLELFSTNVRVGETRPKTQNQKVMLFNNHRKISSKST